MSDINLGKVTSHNTDTNVSPDVSPDGSHVTKSSELWRTFYLGGERVDALKNVSVAIPPASFTVITGPSGSGKTTLLNCLGLIDNPDSGTVEINNTVIDFNNQKSLERIRRNTLGFIFQSFNLIPVLTALENVEVASYDKTSSTSSLRDEATDLLTKVGLDDRLHHRPNQLSGGQQQRVSVARALMGTPRIVLADEPTASLDTKTALFLIKVMRDLAQDLQVAFIFSTHDHRLLDAADHIFKMKDGELMS